MVEQRSDQASVTDAVRWLGPLEVAGETRDALFCHPTSHVVYEFMAPARARVVAYCALLPEVWAKNQGGIEFSLTVSGPRREAQVTRTLRSKPGRRRRDRRWRRLMVAVPGKAPHRVEVTLETRIPAGEAPDWAWAVWGEPALEWRRSLVEIASLARPVFRLVRDSGVRLALRRLRATLDDTQFYQAWLARHTPTGVDLEAMRAASSRFRHRPVISVVTPVYDTDPRWLRRCVESVRRQTYPLWELCLCDDGSKRVETLEVLRSYEGDPKIRISYLPENRQISVASNAALSLATGEFVAFLDHDDELAPDALFEVAKCLNEHPETDFVYSDEDKLDLDGVRCDPFFKPDWSPEHFLSAMYTCHLTVVRRALVEQVGGFRVGYEGSQDYDLALRLVQLTTRIHHLPKVLYHWRKIPESTANAGAAKPWAHHTGKLALEDYVRRNGLNAQIIEGEVPCVYRVRFAIAGDPLVSVVVATAPHQVSVDQFLQLERTISMLARRTAYRHLEVLVAADDGRLPETVERLLSGMPHRVLPANSGTSVSRQVNLAAACARGEHLLICDYGLEAADSDWLTSLLEFSQQAAIGAVGGKLLYSGGRVGHIGMLLGVGGAAAPAMHGHPTSSYGHFSSAIGTRNYSAVSRSCLMTRREVFDRVAGFSEDYAAQFEDVDYCLRVRQAGYRVVFTPYAQFVHWGPGWLTPSDERAEDARRLRARWGETLDRDPYYNPNLSRETPDYQPAV